MQTHQSIVDLGEGRTGKFDQIDLNSSRREIFLERRDHSFWLRLVKRPVKQIHSDHAERFLLLDIRFVEHAHVNDDLAWLAMWLGLKSHAEPAMRFGVVLETARRYRVGKNKKRALVAKLFPKPFE